MMTRWMIRACRQAVCLRHSQRDETISTRRSALRFTPLLVLVAFAALFALQAPTQAASAATHIIDGAVATMTSFTAPLLSRVRAARSASYRSASSIRLGAAPHSLTAAAAPANAMPADQSIVSTAVGGVDISTEPLVTDSSSLVWEGSFRVPDGPFGTDNDCDTSCATFSYGGTPLAFNPDRGTLFLAGHEQGHLVTEIAIPSISKGPTIDDLSIAGVLRPFKDPTGGLIDSVNPGSPNQKKIGGLFVYQHRLLTTAYDFYDGGNEQVLSHFVSDLNLVNKSGPQRVKQLGPSCDPTDDSDCLHSGYFDGYFGMIPPEWQAALGGPVLNGQCCLNVIGRTSWGPAAFALDPAELGIKNPITGALDDVFAKPLVYYWSNGAVVGEPGFHALAEPTLRPADPPYFGGDDACHNTSSLFNCTTEVRGVIFPQGTRSVLFFGRQGLGNFCYGQGTDIKALHGQSADPADPDVVYCYDPADHNKGTHAWPYAHYVWAYDANDLKDVRSGLTLPWEIKPYAVWQMNLPFDAPYGVETDTEVDLQSRRIGGATYDAASGRMFVSQTFDDGRTPLIHVYKLQLATNNAPVANSASSTTAEDTQLTGSLVATDGDSDVLAFALGGVAGHGTAVVSLGGGYVYTPFLNYNGPDSFTYNVSDGHGGSATATVNITVTPVNDNPTATGDTATLIEDSGATAIAVLANDSSSPDAGETLSVTAVTQGAHGSVTFSATGVIYTPAANYNGADSFTYAISDGNGGSASATVGVTVTSVNDNPIASGDGTSVAEDSGANAIAVLANDSIGVDVGETLSVTAVTQGAHGSVTFSTSGVIYTPAANYNGADSFTYTIGDGNGGSATASVAVTVTSVNDNPIASADSATVAEDSGLTDITVLANDSIGPDTGETLTVTSVTQGAHGGVTFTATGVSYRPAADYNGADSFTYTISDGNGGSATATVNVTVTSVNDAPVANGDSATVAEDSGASAVAVLANDTLGPDAGETLIVTAVTQGAHGGVTFTASGVRYTPAPDYNGADSFTYTIADGNGGSATATVNVTVTSVNDNPVAGADSATVAEDGGANAIAVLSNDTIGPDTAETLTITRVTQGAHGSVTFTAAGVSYTPAPNYNGSDAFTYTIGDGNGGSATATVSVTVTSVNDNPIANADTATVAQDSAATAIAVLANDTIGPDTAETLTVTAVTQGAHGAVTFTASGVTYAPVAGFNGADSFTYTIADGHGGSATATVSVTVTPVVNAPEGLALKNPGPQVNREGDSVSLQLQWVSAPDAADSRRQRRGNRPMMFAALNLPEGLQIDRSTGLIEGRLRRGSAGVYRVIAFLSVDGETVYTTFVWTVRGNHAPKLTVTRKLVSTAGQTIAPVIVTATDEDGDALVFTATGLPPGLQMSAAGVITGTIAANARDEYDVTIRVSDGTATDTDDIDWRVQRSNRPSQSGR